MQHRGQYVRGPGLDFDRQHPDVYAQVLAEIRQKVAAPAPEPQPAAQPQGALL